MAELTDDEARAIAEAEPENHEAEPQALEYAVTPTEAHFVRCHFPVPRAHPGAVAIGGAVARPAELSLAELRAMDQRTVVVTLECAGNGRLEMAPLPPGEPWRRGAVSTAVWTGVPLAELLARVGLRDDVVEILATGADRGAAEPGGEEIAFARALPVADALGRGALVALEMNGAAIPVLHGGPVRLVVPGWYGMASVKWLASLAAITRPFGGYFQTGSYVYDDAPVTTMRVSSLIVAPREGARVATGRVEAWGWAWSGDAPVAGVEVSLDAGPWRPALVEPSRAVGAWVRWHAPLAIARRGRHSLRARARDAAGRVQPEAPVRNRLGYGNHLVPTVAFWAGPRLHDF